MGNEPPVGTENEMNTRTKVSVVVVTAVAALMGVGMWSSGHESAKPDSRPAAPARKPARSKPLPRELFMPGDGGYQMGGLDGRDWGVWRATAPGPRGCSWSIRSVSQYADSRVINTGEAAAGKPVQVDIEPDGNVEASGLIGDHRIMFQTSGCGAWHLAS
jgi:hypothetical protein